MYKKIYFYYDRYGKFLGEDCPLILTADQCNCSGFYLTDSRMRGTRGEVPCIMIDRYKIKNVHKDPYNCDGNPPTVLLSIAFPHYDHGFESVTIEGIEIPNLVWSGYLSTPYNDLCVPEKHLPGAMILQRDTADLIHDTPFEGRTRQRIILC